MDIIERLVDNVIDTKYEDLPDEAIKATKRNIIDTIAVLVAGSTAPGCETLVNLVREWGGKEESTVLIHNGKVPALNAALVNSVMARALDFDNGMAGGMHPSASIVPTALAVAEMCGSIDGREFLTTITLGDDLAARINRATNPSRFGFDPTGTSLVFGTAAISGRILGLDREKMLDALGIAFNQAAGNMQSNIDGTLTVRLIQGLTSRAGILSAILAQRGITGVRNILQGVYGFFHLFAHDKVNLEALTDGLGEKFEGVTTIYKKYPSCGATLATTDAALELCSEHNIEPGEVAEITVNVSQWVYHLVGRPFEIRSSPEVDAQFSIPYTVANALVRRSSTIKHFTEEFVRSPEIIELAEKVHLVVAQMPEYMRMEIKMRDGDCWSKSIKYPRGFPQNPLTDEEFKEKWEDCVAYTPKPLPEGNFEKLAKMVNKMEEVDDVSKMVELLVA